ncbi:MAG: UDP-glucose 4-epimerase GalE [Alphaproteobacteria bacterium]|nr:UDP-glucose 4-epimerase GalE [Alphaproteobacteria bacterium]
MANILVTGGAGYIGSHTCKQLAASGHTPIVYDNLSNGHRDAVRWGPFEAGDITDGARLRAVIQAHKPQAVIHFAGLIEVGISVADPAAFYHANVYGSLTLLQALVDEGVSSVVFSSTAAVYGQPETVPIPEGAPSAPINPYGETKRAVEEMLGSFAAAHGLRYTALRYFNAAGADPEGDLGERHDPESHLIPLVLFAALGQRPHINIYGTDYPTPDGTAVRDYAHVSDLALAHVAALDYLQSAPEPLIANLGTGTGYSVRQVVETCRRITGRDIPAQDAPRRDGDPPALVAAVERAHDRLGWRAQISDLDTIVATAWAWHLSQSKAG